MVKKKSGIKNPTSIAEKSWKNNPTFWLIAILIITVFAFSNSLTNDFTNFDDDLYVTNNPLIRELSISGISNIFKAFFDDELPLTHLSLAINYHFSKLNPFAYHLTNLILHLINIILIYYFLKKINKNNLIILASIALFAVHPLRVESVSWVTERKDLLFSTFLILSFITYIKFIETNKIQNYLLTILLYIFAFLSKQSAHILIVMLIGFDLFFKRKISIKLILEKIPFLLLLVFAVYIHFNHSFTNQVMHAFESDYHILDQIFMGSYALGFYFIKTVLPFNQSPIYPYPIKINNLLPWYYYVIGVITLATVLIVIYKFLHSKNKYDLKFFGFFFTLVSFSLVLHIVPLGGRMVLAERYTYLPHIGMFLCFVTFISQKFEAKMKENSAIIKTIVAGFITISIVFTYLTIKQNRVWANSLTLYSSAINSNQNNHIAWHNRAQTKAQLNDFVGAETDFSKAIQLNPEYIEAYSNFGNLKFKQQKFSEAINLYNIAIKKFPNYDAPMLNRGKIWRHLKEYDKAQADFNFLINNNSEINEVYLERGLLFEEQQNYVKALQDYDSYLLKPEAIPDVYYYKARIFNKQQKYDAAINQLNLAEGKGVKTAKLFQLRANAKAFINDYNGAINDYSNALQINPNDGGSYLNRGLSYYQLKMNNKACSDWNSAKSLGINQANNYLNNYCK